MKPAIILFAVIFLGGFSSCKSQQKTTQPKTAGDTAYTYRPASRDGIGKFYMGREIAQVMGAAGSDWLERDTRNMEENTSLSIEKITVPPNGVIADIGAGTGYYSFRLTAKVPAGKVYAVDIQEELISYLKNKKKELRDSIVEVVKSSRKSPNLPDNSVDLAIMVDVYHELEFPQEMLQAIRKCLKPDGKILLIEYRLEDPAIPIKELHKTSVAQLNRELNRNGFILNYKGEFLPIQHFLLYGKK
ncbi:class I SAM-dependent methyltransferase [Flavihumibacter profundi]|jgi:SAM-dependent methyltransferase|uniref:class I SAM-dependent methyltransferase n=1 Tax=Flavihumibacter profundi TaxID=2716883 RepID=UPI001CC7CFC4|nr:class I SAM-dependent methyltransferase [Flavihumibacter profundi]MBZ5855545.1 class I SAM-dependent methyltransferase [Flavihumibacter profundi]